MKYSKHSKWRHFTRSPYFLLVILIAFGFLAKATWSIHEKTLVSGERLTQAQTELFSLQNRATDLKGQVVYLSTQSGIEAELRTKYRAVKEGESVAVIVDKSQSAAVGDIAKSASSSNEVGWWHSFLQKLGF